MANESTSKSANMWLALVAGLAVGFAVGREMGGRSAPEPEAAAKVAAAAAGAPSAGGGAPAYASEAQFPSGWMKSADLASVAGVNWAGLSDAQKTTAMQVLNERKCECGCGMESVAICAKKDTTCPKSPKLTKDVVDMVRQGKGLADLRAYMDRENPPKAGGAAAPAAAPPQASVVKVAIPAHAPRKGPKNAKVTIVAFSDFQCPFCSRVLPTLKEIEKNYPKDVALVFVNQPLSFHDRAEPAGRAFLAADRQGKGWEMHDKLFANQQALSDADLERYAGELKLNVAKWKKDFADPQLKQQVASDQALANSVGANGTPTFRINGREVVGAQPFPAFKAIIDEEIKKADELLKKGIKPAELYDKIVEQNIASAPAAPAPTPAGPAPAPAPAEKVQIALGDAPVKGSKKAPVEIVVFSDFQCPFCSRVNPSLKQIEETYKDKVRIAFKHLPLPFHDKAQLAAEASMAAHEQGKFWEMHDKLFANQQALDRPSLERYAQELNLNMAKFKAALDGGKYRDLVQKDAALAGTVGASGTPTSFINGRKLEGAVPFDQFKSVIDEELAKKR